MSNFECTMNFDHNLVFKVNCVQVIPFVQQNFIFNFLKFCPCIFQNSNLFVTTSSVRAKKFKRQIYTVISTCERNGYVVVCQSVSSECKGIPLYKYMYM